MSKVWRYGDHVDTDVIIPARYLNIADFDELAEHAMEDIDTTFAPNVQPGDYVVAGKNFGCGSSREHAPVVIKVKGVKCIIADSFARIFYRNAINIGLPVLEIGKDVEKIAIDLKTLTKNIHNTNTPLDVFDKEKYVDWVWGESIITGEKRLVPASMVFFSNVVFEGNFFPLSSSGLAAGGTLDDAILQGLFELIEHDAWIMGQSIPRKLPLLDFSSSANTKLLDKISLINEAGYEIVTRDYTNDIGIPVFRTWIVNSKNYNKYATNGFGASLDPEIALERSVTEAVQSANDEDLVDIEIYGKSNANYLSSDPSSVYNLNYFINKDIRKNRDEKVNKFEKYRIKNYGNVKEVLKATKSILQSKIKDLDLIYVNLTREKIGIPVVRVLAIGDLQTVGLPMLSVSPRTFNFGNIEKSHEESLRYEDLYMGIYPH